MGEYIRVRFRFSWPLVVSLGRRAPRRQIWIFKRDFNAIFNRLYSQLYAIACDKLRNKLRALVPSER